VSRALAVLLATLLLGAALPATAAAAWPTPIWSGPESAYAEFNEGSLGAADDLLDDVWPARSPRKPVRLAWPLTWTEDPYADAYWRFYFYGLRPTSHLLWAYATTRDARYLTRLKAILASYAARDAVRPFDRLTFDNPHAAAYRAMVLTNTVVKLRRWAVLPAQLEHDLTASLRRLGAFLEEPRNFEQAHNHGYNEALALLLIARNFPQFPESARWAQLGVDRLQLMLDTTIDADGVEVENSPFYHVYVLGMVAEIATWAGQYEPRLAAPYRAAARKMLRYAAYVTQPDGTLPMLGATARTNLSAQDPAVYGPLRGTEPAFDWVFSSGAAGRPPADGAALFPVSGLYVLRSPLADAPARTDQTFVTFDAGIYRTSHSHLDALSMTIFSRGAVVLPEAGLFTYDAGVDFDYFHGTRGHNTVLVDGRDQAEGAAVPGPSGRWEHGSWAAGTSRLSTGVAHHRTVVVLGQDLVLAVDALVGTGEHDYTQLWHLQPGSRVRALTGGTLVADANGRPSLSIVQAARSGLTRRVVTGATAPMQGWTSTAYGFKTASPALEFHTHARSRALATLLASGPHADRFARVTQEAIPGGRRVAVCAGAGQRHTITIRAEGTPQQTVALHAGCTL
jgi:hypothetical protein